MKAERKKDIFLLRLERGEEIVSSLEKFASKHGIETAEVRAIGALTDFEVGYYILSEKKYDRKKFEVNAELISAMGNLAMRDGKSFLHMHVTAGLPDFSVVGGHFFSGIVSATVEAFVRPFGREIQRIFDEGIGLYLLDLPDEAL
jgi:uncharacterized protein